MLLSGRWPFQTGVVDNALGLRSDEVSLGEAFRRAGYHTGYIGKWHLSCDPRDREFIPRGAARQGFEDWQVWSTANKRHFDRAFTFNPYSGERIRPQGYRNPPHPPFQDAPPEALNRYDPSALQFRPNVPSDIRGGTRSFLRGYYAHISAIDAELGRLLHKLDETGQTKNTIVVYTSDHGTMMGSHGFGGKRLPFDEACRVPFLLRYPEAVTANRESDVLLSSIDLFPTLCGLAGVPVPARCAGADLSAAMRTNATSRGESAFLMHIRRASADSHGSGRLAPLFRGVRTEQFTYVIADDGRWCLYDNSNDPYQLRNLIDDPSWASVLADLDGLVFDWLRDANDPFALDALRLKRSSLQTLDVGKNSS
jgi:arylsulfatase A-like enzyme